MAFSGINFRNLQAYVTDGGSDTWCAENGGVGDVYPTTRGGKTFGFTTVPLGNFRDRDATNDPRLAGIAYPSTSTPVVFKFDLPGGAGTYNFRLAMGEELVTWAHRCVVKDGATTLATITGTTAAAQWMDAGGNIRNEAAWVSSNTTIPLTFATGTMTLEFGDGTGSVNSTVAHVAVEQVATAPTIGTEPTTQNVTAPAAATFSAVVSGTYTGLQWERQAAGAGGWSDVASATSSTLVTGATSVSGGSWNSTDRVRLRVDWSGGASVYSTDVALTVAASGTAPAVTVPPANTSVTVGATATFSVTATGSGTKTYQWERQPAAGGGYSAISGATSASYTTPVTTISGGAANLGDTYRCVVTGDTSPPATSSAATLTVLYPVATTVSVTLTTDGSTPAASLTNLKWAFYDQATPDLFTAAPVAKGAVETTDGSGVFSASITGTALRQNDIGYLIVTNSDGTTTQGAALKCFSAPVAVS